MQRWEYKVVHLSQAPWEWEKQMKPLGSDGWELVFIDSAKPSSCYAVFKRPL